MRRCLVWLLPVIAVITIILVRTANGRVKRSRVEADGQAALSRYSAVLRPGFTRKDIQAYLRAHNAAFSERCCYPERSAFATITKIGDLGAPWFCSEYPLYVAFEFTPVPVRDPVMPSDTDVLKYIHLVSNGEGCL